MATQVHLDTVRGRWEAPLHAIEVELEQLERAKKKWMAAFLVSTFVSEMGELEGNTLSHHDFIHAGEIIQDLGLLLVCVIGWVAS